MFIDWLKITQEHTQDLPIIGDLVNLTVDIATGEEVARNQPRLKHEGSFSTSVHISIRGRRITVDGNPSRYSRLDNLVGFQKLDQCIDIYNKILAKYGLPAFTKCTRYELRSAKENSKASSWSDGAQLMRIDLTTNFQVGKGNETQYLRALSMQKIGRLNGHTYPDGGSVDWTPSGGGKAGRALYHKVYNKALEIKKMQLSKVKRKYGEHSDEYNYLLDLYNFCVEFGVVRYEQSFKQEHLKRKSLTYWGLFNESIFNDLHNDFLGLDSKLSVSKMDIKTIADTLLEKEIVSSRQAANTTTLYYHMWLEGADLDFSKTQIRTHAARLNKIGINIRVTPDLTRYSAVTYVQGKAIVKTDLVDLPSWYRKPNHLKAVA